MGYPGVQGIGYNYVDPVNDTPNLIKFLKELRVEFDLRSPNKHLEITAAVGATTEVIRSYSGTAPYFDYILAMTYDYAGSWSSGGHLAGLYYNPASLKNSSSNVDSTITNLLNAGFLKNKIIMGIPLYGTGWKKIVPTNPALPIFGQSVSGGAGTKEWRELRGVIGQNGLTRYYDSVAHAAFVHNSSTGETWSYDDPATVKEKAQYVERRGLAGVMFWQISGDTRDGQDSLISTAVTELKS